MCLFVFVPVCEEDPSGEESVRKTSFRSLFDNNIYKGVTKVTAHTRSIVFLATFDFVLSILKVNAIKKVCDK